jgi:ferrous iron transport protein A
MEESEIRSLSQVRNGQKVRLVRVDAGHGLNGRLAAMGLVRGVEITVVRNEHPGPFIVSVKGTRVMLGRGMAHKILVYEDD